jgi:Na+-driven multidrug efflux pump
MDLLKDNIPKLVRKLAVPAMVGTLFQTLYNVVDTFFAGKISPEALSALSKSFPNIFYYHCNIHWCNSCRNIINRQQHW